MASIFQHSSNYLVLGSSNKKNKKKKIWNKLRMNVHFWVSCLFKCFRWGGCAITGIVLPKLKTYSLFTLYTVTLTSILGKNKYCGSQWLPVSCYFFSKCLVLCLTEEGNSKSFKIKGRVNDERIFILDELAFVIIYSSSTYCFLNDILEYFDIRFLL